MIVMFELLNLSIRFIKITSTINNQEPLFTSIFNLRPFAGRHSTKQTKSKQSRLASQYLFEANVTVQYYDRQLPRKRRDNNPIMTTSDANAERCSRIRTTSTLRSSSKHKHTTAAARTI